MSHELYVQIKAIEARARADIPRALEQASELIEQHPDDAKVWSLRGYLNALSRNWVSAIDDFTRAISIEPSEPVLFYDRGRHFIEVGDYQSAIDDFTRGLVLCDMWSNDYYRESFHFFRAYAYLMLGDKNAAKKDLNSVRDGFSTWIDVMRTKEELLAQCSAP